MKKNIYILLTTGVMSVNGLLNSFGGYNRNNKYIKYNANEEPCKDLYKISSSEASSLSKQWLNDILKEFNNEKIYKTGRLEDCYIVKSINLLEDYIGEHRKLNDIYIKWRPMSNKKERKALFIIALELDDVNKILVLKQLIQSPEWNQHQIESNKLKEALISYTTNFKDYSLDLEYLYKHDLRYKLSWITWYLK